MPATHAQGRTFLVTGANSGIGRALAEALVARGGRVVLAARSEVRTRPVLDSIRTRDPGIEPRFLSIDLVDLASVRRAAESFLAAEDKLRESAQGRIVNLAGVGHLTVKQEGVRTPLYRATAPELATMTGRYYVKCREAPCNPLANDEALAKELWARTEAAVAAAS